MGTESLRAGGQTRIAGLDAVRWVPVAIATQVPLPKINADGVRCGLPGALGSGGCKQDPHLQGSVAGESWSLFLAGCQVSSPKVPQSPLPWPFPLSDASPFLMRVPGSGSHLSGSEAWLGEEGDCSSGCSFVSGWLAE